MCGLYLGDFRKYVVIVKARISLKRDILILFTDLRLFYPYIDYFMPQNPHIFKKVMCFVKCANSFRNFDTCDAIMCRFYKIFAHPQSFWPKGHPWLHPSFAILFCSHWNFWNVHGTSNSCDKIRKFSGKIRAFRLFSLTKGVITRRG